MTTPPADPPGALLEPERLLGGGDARDAVVRLLADAWGTPVELAGAEVLADRDHVVRVTTADGRSAVVKRSRAEPAGRWNADVDGVAAERAALEHLASMPAAPVPRLWGADPDGGVMVLEDLRVERTLADSLLGADAAQARADVVALGTALGAVHGWSLGRSDDLVRRRAEHGIDAPERNRWADVVRLERQTYGDALDRLGLGGHAGPGLDADLDALDVALAGGRWRGFVHGDLCPDNAVVAGGRLLVLDLERASPGSIALDAAYLVAPFPSCWCFGAVPDDLATEALAAHRRAMGGYGVELDDSWDVAVAAALGAWLVARTGAAARALDADDGARMWGTTTMRPRAVRWAEAFVSTPAARDAFPHLHGLATSLRDRLLAAWPGEEMPQYPPFAAPGAVVAVAPEDWAPPT